MTAVFPTAIPDFTGEVGVPADEIAEWATHISEELVAVARGGSPVRTVTDDYTLVADDAGKVVEANKASAIAVTVPPNASVPFPIGTMVEVAQLGVGALTLVAGAGVTLNGVLTAAGRYGALLVRKRGANEWVVTQAPATGFATQADLDDEEDARIAGDALAIPLTQKAAANGVASLGADGILTMAQRPAAASPTLTGLRGAAVGTDIVSMGVTADTNDRFVQNADGKLEWGSGAAAVDTNLYRSAASVLTTDDELRVVLDLHARYGAAGQVTLGTAGPSSEAGIKFGSAGDTNLYRSAASLLKTDDTLVAALDVYSRYGAATQVGMGALGPAGVAGVVFGSAADVNLYRSAADVLKTDDSLQAVRLGLGVAPHADHELRVVKGVASAIGPATGAVLTGDATTRQSTVRNGLVVQMYAGAWSAAGVAYQGIASLLDVPVGANFVPWGVGSVVRSAAAAVNNGAGVAGVEPTAFWGRAEGSAGAPLWGAALEVEDKVGATTAAADMHGLEVAIFKRSTGSVVKGLFLVAKGDFASNHVLFATRESSGSWTTGARLEGFVLGGTAGNVNDLLSLQNEVGNANVLQTFLRHRRVTTGSGWETVALRLENKVDSTDQGFISIRGNNFGIRTDGLGDNGNGVVAIANAVSVPSTNPSGGSVVYAEAGALKARGSSGTVTTMAPAEPHCPTCGRDFALEWQSDTLGHLVLCMWCVSEQMDRGVIVRAAA